MNDGVFDADRVAAITVNMDNNLSMLLDAVSEFYGLSYGEAATIALGMGLGALECEWARVMARKLREEGRQ